MTGTDTFVRRPHLLESFDSVRSAWTLDAQAREDAYVLAWVETLLALAFGRDLVVPQSYAVDSYAFQQVLVEVAAAHRACVDGNPRHWVGRPVPVRLHLHRTDSFADAAAAIVRRVGAVSDDPDAPPFRSSLFPDLARRADVDAVLAELADGGTSRTLAAAYPDGRGELFARTAEWFAPARAGVEQYVVTPAPVPTASLDAQVAQLIGPRVLPLVVLASPEDADVIGRCTRAIQALGDSAGRGEPFAVRSRLYEGQPWTADGRSAADVVGEDVALVREVVDTLYNRVLVASVGTASASYSTAVGPLGTLVDTAVAQGLALHVAGDASGDPDQASSDPAGRRTLEVHINAGGAGHGLAGLLQGRSVEALRLVLDAGADPRWQGSLLAMARAEADRSPTAVADAVAAHTALLAERLGSLCQVDVQPSGRVFVRLLRSPGGTAAAAAGTSAAAEAFSIAAQAHPGVLVGFAAASAAGGALGGWWRQRRTARRPGDALRGAVAQVVQARETR